MNFLLVVVLIILLIFKIKILKKGCKEKSKNLWPIYFSTLVAEVTSLLGVYIIQTELIGISFNDFIIFGIICLICIIENIILSILGIVCFFKQRNNIIDKNIKTKNHTLIKIILTFLCIYVGMFFVAYIPRIFKTEIEKYIEDYVVEYMTEKYGDGDFKVINIAKDYTGGFFGETEKQKGYYVKIKTSYINEIIGMFIDGTTKETIEISYDSLILDYHKVDDIVDFQDYLMNKKIKIVEDEYKKYFDVDIDFYCHYEVPDDYGHIPSIDELVELCSVNTNYINIDIKEKNLNFENKLEYLKMLALFSMKYFDTNEEINIYYTWNGAYNWNGKMDYIKINDDEVKIKINSRESVFKKEDIQNYIN